MSSPKTASSLSGSVAATNLPTYGFPAGQLSAGAAVAEEVVARACAVCPLVAPMRVIGAFSTSVHATTVNCAPGFAAFSSLRPLVALAAKICVEMSAPVPSMGSTILTPGKADVQETPWTEARTTLAARSRSVTLMSKGVRSWQVRVTQAVPELSPVTGAQLGVAVPNAAQKLFCAAPKLLGRFSASSA